MRYSFIALGVFLCFLWMGCPIDPWGGQNRSDRPLVIPRSQFEAAVKVLPPRIMRSPGKFYTKSGFLFIVERWEGIHVIDNRDIERPDKHAFIRVPGCEDIAAKGEILYANSAGDLLAFDLADLNNITLVSRQRDALPDILPSWGRIPEELVRGRRPDSLVIIGWENL